MAIFRENTNDEAIWNYVSFYNKYNLPNDMDGTVIVDIGCHIGSFIDACLRRKASFVYGYEPHPENVDIAIKNLGFYRENICIYTKAVWGNFALMPEFKHTGFDYDTGAGNVWDDDGFLPVESITLDDAIAPILAKHHLIDVLKVSCNGAEHPILMGSNLEGIANIIGDYTNFAIIPNKLRLLGKTITVKTLGSHLENQGFTFEFEQSRNDSSRGRFIAVRKL